MMTLLIRRLWIVLFFIVTNISMMEAFLSSSSSFSSSAIVPSITWTGIVWTRPTIMPSSGTTSTTTTTTTTTTTLPMSLKPAAIPLMDSGKALARSGELLIDLTNDLELYGGALSSTGALIRNAGDTLAQAAALCRFKTGTESACDELREAASCFMNAKDKLQQAIREAETDQDPQMVQTLQPMIETMAMAGTTLEQAGKGIMMRTSLKDIGGNMVACGAQLQQLSEQILTLSPSDTSSSWSSSTMTSNGNGQISSQRMAYAAEKMILAGNELMGTIPNEKPKGKGWLKG